MDGTVFAPALEGIQHVKSEAGEILTKPFLEVCKHILPVIGGVPLESFCLLNDSLVSWRLTAYDFILRKESYIKKINMGFIICLHEVSRLIFLC